MHYYNEFDPQAAAWLQVLIDQHLIPEGVVDTRSIVEVTAADLGDFVQCHFFAGIGGWPLALQLAGVPASTRLWTGSCPCQPFSVAGEGKGIADERHLWPVFFALIRACNPPLVFGEQVASAAVVGSSAKPTKRSAGKAVPPVWLDGVFADLESAGYACGSADIPAAGVGAPHIRQRCWWGAVRLPDAIGKRRGGRERPEDRSFDDRTDAGRIEGNHGSVGVLQTRVHRMADSIKPRLEGHAGNGDHGDESGRNGADQAGSVAEGGESGRMGDTPSGGLGIIGDASLAGSCGHAHGSGECGGVAYAQGEGSSPGGVGTALAEPRSEGKGSGGVGNATMQQCGGTRKSEASLGRAGASGRSDPWTDSYWHPCRDGKYRRVPTEPGLFPLADGLPYRVARRRTVRPPLLRGAGNAICPEVATEFVKAFYEVITP